MKRLTLLRHAKSSWDDPVERDFDRGLNDRGRRAACVMGQWMARNGLASFDLVLVSPAVRTLETLAEVSRCADARWPVQEERRIYLASSVTLLDVVHEVPDTVQNLLLLGHNPGLEDLVLDLVPAGAPDDLRAILEVKYPTAALAQLDCAIDHWADLAKGVVTLTHFVRPRDLDPELGPED